VPASHIIQGILMSMRHAVKRTDLTGLEELALRQGGYFDRRDAQAHGIGDDLLSYHVKTGRFERLFPGVFRLRIAPLDHHDDLLLAWVWSNYRATVSHESALALFQLSDVLPSQTHLTVPPSFRRQPGPFRLHRSHLTQDDVTTYESLPVTTPARTIVDAAAWGTDPGQIQLATRQAVQRGLASVKQLRAAAQRPGYRHRQTVKQTIETAIANVSA
jgi:predicted transcriptional regulator of viral defense system